MMPCAPYWLRVAHMATNAQNINNTTIRSERKLAHLEQLPLLLPDAPQAVWDTYEQAKQELFETVKAVYACKQEEGQSISSYLLKMKSYLDTLERLGYVMANELGVSLILNSLNKDYDQFIQNYNMHSIGKTIAELHAMLKTPWRYGIPMKG
ncbi:hypothetical protein Tco_0737900 [Tanacetum coccineum]